MWTTGGGQRKRFSLPYDFCATAACRHITVVIIGMDTTRVGSWRRWSRTIRRILVWGSSDSVSSNLRLLDDTCCQSYMSKGNRNVESLDY